MHRHAFSSSTSSFSSLAPNGLAPNQPSSPSPLISTSTSTSTHHLPLPLPLPTSISPTSPTTFADTLPLPRLLIFDLDYTLWPFWADTHPTPPLKPKDSSTRLQDKWGESFSFYPGVAHVLYAARERGITLGIASRTSAPEVARELLKGLVVVPPFDAGGADELGLGLEIEGKEKAKKKEKEKKKAEKPLRAWEYFDHVQIFPGEKVTHMERIVEAERKKGKEKGKKKKEVLGRDGEGGAEVAYADILFFDDEARNRNVEVELGVTFWLVRDGISKEEIDSGVWEWRKRRGIFPPGQGEREDGWRLGR